MLNVIRLANILRRRKLVCPTELHYIDHLISMLNVYLKKLEAEIGQD